MITLPLSERGSSSHSKLTVFTKTDLCRKYGSLFDVNASNVIYETNSG